MELKKAVKHKIWLKTVLPQGFNPIASPTDKQLKGLIRKGGDKPRLHWIHTVLSSKQGRCV
jgi:hypothetical protein